MPPSNTPRYTVVIDQAAQKSMRRLPRDLQERLGRAILVLETNPRPNNSRQLEGFRNTYRLRVGDWRIIYTVEDDRLVITVIRVGSRGDIYRGL